MKITAVKPVPITYGHRSMLLVKVETDAGVHGWGEGGISGHERAMAGCVEAFADRLAGEDPRRIDHLWQLMFRGGFFEGGTILGGALSAVDLALWDILGKHLNVPCWQLLGGRSRDRIECYLAVGLANAAEAVAAGWRYLRFGAGPAHGKDGGIFDPDEAVRSVHDTVRQTRERLGEDVRICIDFHTRFNPPAAAQACNLIAPYRPFFVEDPLRSPSAANYAAFRSRTHVPLAVGEECSSKWEFQQLIEKDAIDYARIDLCNVGGLTEARKVAAMAETHYIDVIPHNPLGPISTAACVHLAAAIPNFMVLEHGPGPDHAPDLFEFKLERNVPWYEIPAAPGLGVDVREAALPKHPYKPWLAPLLRRPDGGFNNW
ncbi:MAG: mandelate racemase/muconate lactonizing enzyme family protein [Planctomycetota bacterium]|nr:mandelate racemase/muconate lactonizing enzyme family protein [Planctomycetota bacterium]